MIQILIFLDVPFGFCFTPRRFAALILVLISLLSRFLFSRASSSPPGSVDASGGSKLEVASAYLARKFFSLPLIMLLHIPFWSHMAWNLIMNQEPQGCSPLFYTNLLVFDHTDDFLASCAVVVSSLLPPFARTMNTKKELSNAVNKFAKNIAINMLYLYMICPSTNCSLLEAYG